MVKDYSKHYNDLTRLMGELRIKISATIAGFNSLSCARCLNQELVQKKL